MFFHRSSISNNGAISGGGLYFYKYQTALRLLLLIRSNRLSLLSLFVHSLSLSFRRLRLFFFAVSQFFIFLCRVSPARPAPAEFPQGWKAARVSGCSGAMQVAYPFWEVLWFVL
jgi:hypothetical protein